MIVWSCLELGDTVAMSPVDRMRSLSLKLVSLGKIYAGTPRYFPLGKYSYPPVFMLIFFSSCLIFPACCLLHFAISNIISLPCGIIYASMSLWYRSAGWSWCCRWLLNYPLITASLFKPVFSVETVIHFLYILGTAQACSASIMSDAKHIFLCNDQSHEHAIGH